MSTLMHAVWTLTLRALALALCSTAVSAQYPSKPVRLLVPFGAGSSTDVVARIVAQHLSSRRSASRSSSIIGAAPADIPGTEIAVRSAPDGHTLLLATNSPLSAAPHLKKKLPYDPLADFTPICLVGRYTFFVVVHPSVPAATLQELIGYAQANPGKVNYATGNTTSIVSTATFAALTGIRIVHVPYKTEPPAVTDLLSGQIHMMVSSYSTVAPHVREGKLRALVTTLDARSPLLPDVPAITEAGMSKFPIVPWAGLFGPARLTPEIVQRLNTEVNATLNRPDVKEQLAKQAFAGAGPLSHYLGAFEKELAVRGLGPGDPRHRDSAGVVVSPCAQCLRPDRAHPHPRLIWVRAAA